MAEKKKSWHCLPWNLSDAFCFMCCRKGLWRSDITVCWETAIKRRNWRSAKGWPTHRFGQGKSFRLCSWSRNWLATTLQLVRCAVHCFDIQSIFHPRLCLNRILSVSLPAGEGEAMPIIHDSYRSSLKNLYFCYPNWLLLFAFAVSWLLLSPYWSRWRFSSMEIIRTAAECSRFRACCFSSAALRIIRYSFAEWNHPN